MPKSTDQETMPEVRDIMEAFIERFPGVFEGFEVNQIEFWLVRNKKSKVPMKLVAVGFPCYLSMKPYVVLGYDGLWKEMSAKQRNLAVFHIMCAFPDGAFDEQSNYFGKKATPTIQMFMNEFAVCGGIPNWMESPDAARDPMKVGEEELDGGDAIPEEEGKIPSDGIQRNPVSKETIATVGQGVSGAAAT